MKVWEFMDVVASNVKVYITDNNNEEYVTEKEYFSNKAMQNKWDDKEVISIDSEERDEITLFVD